jgi:hypothetical protein
MSSLSPIYVLVTLKEIDSYSYLILFLDLILYSLGLLFCFGASMLVGIFVFNGSAAQFKLTYDTPALFLLFKIALDT